MAMFSTLNGIMGGGGAFNEVMIGGVSVPQAYLSEDGKSYGEVTTTTGSSGIFAFDKWISMSTIARYSEDDGTSFLNGVISGGSPTITFGSQKVATDGTTVTFVDNSTASSIVHTTDGINHTVALSGGGGGVNKVIAHEAGSTNPWVMAVRDSGNTRFRRGSDGVTWLGSTTLAVGNPPNGLAFNGSIWVCTQSGSSFIKSLDGAGSWALFANNIDISTYDQLGEIRFAKGLWVMNAHNKLTNRVTILTTPDIEIGVWTERTLPGVAIGGQLLALNYSKNLGLFVTCGVTTGTGTKGVSYYSTSGTAWFEASLSVGALAQLEYVAVRG